MIQTHTYGSGLKLIVRTTDFLRSVSIGVFAAAGSAFETQKNNGISHFTEHMLFKGTNKRTAFDIAECIDRIGGQINAYTSKENTCYYTRSVSEHFEYCAEVLSDIVFDSVFAQDELEREKKVVQEEISMQEDSPEDLCHEYLAGAFFKGNPLAMTILGTPENVSGFTRDDIIDYMAKRYCARNMVVSIVGDIAFDKTVDVVGKYFDARITHGCELTDFAPPHVTAPAFVCKKKEIEQANIALAFPCYAFNDPRSYSASLFSTVFGGGMSSRLFQRIREQQGLAYSVYTYVSSYKQNGLFSVFLGTNPANTDKALASIKSEIGEVVQNGLTEQEFEKGKAQMKGAFIMGQESASSVLNAMGKLLLLGNEAYDMDKRLSEIDAVTMQSVRDAAEYTLDMSKMSGSIVGPQEYNLEFGVST
ncbi:MAG: insulinase family protein [Firmicutes bacterium]|nr:insulinase family protein [Bacillota bacterium]